MILKLHGTSGSGKSTIAFGFLGATMQTNKPLLNPANRKVEGYECHLPTLRKPLFILGPYNSQCGGLDSISDVTDHIRLLLTYGRLGHVFYEGLLGSEYYGRIGKASEEFGDRHIFAFLDTPIEECIARIKKRRLLKGNTKPLNEDNTRLRVAKIDRLKHRLEFEFHRPVVDIDHTCAMKQLHQLYVTAESYE